MSYKEPVIGEYGHIPEDDERFRNPDFVAGLNNFSELPVDKKVENYSKKSVTEKQIDYFVDTTGMSYDDAFRHFGISPDDIETSDNFASQELISGPHVDLDKRAIHLPNALDGFLKANKLRSFNARSEYDEILKSRVRVPEKIMNSEEQARAEANKQFYKAFGSEALIAAGYDPEYIARETESEAAAFIKTYIGPANEKSRKKFRKTLGKYKDNTK